MSAAGHLHLLEMGASSPAVVIVQALGANVLDFLGFYRELAASGMRVCVYDRAGLGWAGAIPRALGGARRSQPGQALAPFDGQLAPLPHAGRARERSGLPDGCLRACCTLGHKGRVPPRGRRHHG